MSKVSKANYIFRDATSFDRDISNWRPALQEAISAFKGASKFDSDLSGWDMSNATTVREMFRNASSFNQDLSSWDVGSVTDKGSFDVRSGCLVRHGFRQQETFRLGPSLAIGCPADVETFVSLEAPASAVAGDELTYELSYWNSSNAITNGNTLVLTLPTDVTLPPGADPEWWHSRAAAR